MSADVYQTDRTLTLVRNGKPVTTAILIGTLADGTAWHISLGRVHTGRTVSDGRGNRIPQVRCAWWTAKTRDEAVRALRDIGRRFTPNLRTT